MSEFVSNSYNVQNFKILRDDTIHPLPLLKVLDNDIK